jgi:hypothetical protein
MSHQLVYRIVLRKHLGEFLSRPFQLGTWSVPRRVLPGNGLRGYRMRSAICLPVCETGIVNCVRVLIGAGSTQSKLPEHRQIRVGKFQ